MAERKAIDKEVLKYFDNIKVAEINGQEHFVLTEDALLHFREDVKKNDEL